MLSQVHILSAHLSLTTEVKECAQPGNRTYKTPYIRLDMLPTAITGMANITLVNVYVDLLVFTRIAGTSYTGSGRSWC